MKNTTSPLKDFSLILACIASASALIVVFIKITNLSVLLAVILVIIGIIYFFNKATVIRDPVTRAFKQRKDFVLSCIMVVIVLFPVILRSSPYWIFILTLAILWTIVALGINIQFGSAGIINLGAAAFFGVGAYTAGMLSTRLGFPPLLNLLLGAVMGMIVGALLFIPILKTRSYYLALVTIAFIMALHTLLNNAEWLGGAQGIVNIDIMSIGGYSFLQEINILGLKLPSQANFYYLALVLGCLLLIADYRIWNSWIGLTWNSFNEDTGDELLAQCMGVEVKKWSMIAFTAGNFYIGLAGAFYSHMTTYIAPPDITFYLSLLFLSAVILGGVDSILGVTVAAVLLVIMPEKLRALQQYWIIIFGIILVLMLIFRRQGLIPARVRTYGLRFFQPTGSSPSGGGIKTHEITNPGTNTKLFRSENLSKNFGGLTAVSGVTFHISEGEILGLIGPNGAGKTTLFNLITGVYKPDGGRFFLKDEDITGLQPYMIKKKGISRTFQQSRLILGASVYDNLFIGMLESFRTGFFDALIRRKAFRRELDQAIEKGNELLRQFNEELVQKGFERTGDISQIDRRRLEICRALATKPALLLLDEPTAGMTPEESVELMEDIKRVQKNYYPDLAIILVEHDMMVIEGITDRVIALNFGQKIAEGSFEEVSRNKELMEAYLGK